MPSSEDRREALGILFQERPPAGHGRDHDWAELRAEAIAAKKSADLIDHGDHHKNDQHDGKNLLIIHNPKRGHQLKADAAGSDRAKDGGGAEVILPTVDRDIGQLRQDLRQDCARDDLEG